jgi:trans-aconitate 2-methyltransferase
MADWDAEAYARISEPQFAWGKRVLERLALRGDEVVEDAGCGAGRLTELLVERLPRGASLPSTRRRRCCGRRGPTWHGSAIG